MDIRKAMKAIDREYPLEFNPEMERLLLAHDKECDPDSWEQMIDSLNFFHGGMHHYRALFHRAILVALIGWLLFSVAVIVR